MNDVIKKHKTLKLNTKRLTLVPFSLRYKSFFYDNSIVKETTRYTTIIGSLEKPN